MHAIFELIQHTSGTRSTILIEGETGTGKELIARGPLCKRGARGKFGRDQLRGVAGNFA